jgi:hypothetical protein
MVFFNFVICLVLAFHVQNLEYIKNYQKESTDKMSPIFLLVNACSIFGGGIDFGRPYSVMVVCVAGLFVLFGVNCILPGLLDWTDKCLGIISALLTNCADLYSYIKYSFKWQRTHKMYLFQYFTSYYFISFYIINFLLNLIMIHTFIKFHHWTSSDLSWFHSLSYFSL